MIALFAAQKYYLALNESMLTMLSLRNKKTVILLVSCLLSLGCSAYEQTDREFFSCDTERGLLSLTLRDGALTFSANGEDGFSLSQHEARENKFMFNNYFRYQASRTEISFFLGGASYILYSDHDGDSYSVGLVMDDGDNEIDYKCKRVVKDDIKSSIPLVSCNKDNALGCAK